MEGVGQALGGADHGLAARVGADQRQDAVAGGPGTGNLVLLHPFAHVVVHVGGGAAQRDLAQGGEVAFLEVSVQGAAGVVGAVDAAFLQPGAQRRGGQVDQLHLVGGFQHVVGQGFGDADAGDAGHVVVEGFEVLDVQRGPHGQPGGDQLGHILPSLGMAGARGVGVGQLVHQQQAGAAGERGVQVELAQDLAAIGHLPQRQQRQVSELGLGFGAAMGLDHAAHHVDPFGPGGGGPGTASPTSCRRPGRHRGRS